MKYFKTQEEYFQVLKNEGLQWIGNYLSLHCKQRIESNRICYLGGLQVEGDIAQIVFDALNQTKKENLQEIRQMARDSIKNGVFLPLEYLMTLYGCTEAESKVLILLLLYEIYREFQLLFSFLADDWELSQPTFFIFNCCTADNYNSLSLLESPWKELLLVSARQRSLLTQIVRFDERILEFILTGKENYEPYDYFMKKITPTYIPEKIFASEEFSILNEKISIAEEKSKKEIFVIYSKEKDMVKEFLFYKVLHTDMPVYMLTLYPEIESATIKRFLRECLIFNALAVFDLWEMPLEKPISQMITDILQKNLDSFLVIAENPINLDWIFTDIQVFEYLLSSVATREIKQFWKIITQNYKLAADVSFSQISSCYKLSPDKIRQVLKRTANSVITQRSLLENCKKILGQQINKKVVKIEGNIGFERLILPRKQILQLTEICNRIRFSEKVFDEWGFYETIPYGFGTSMVFSGSPGTGKTLAAHVLATELGIDLYKIELATVVSKYVGETQKNLEKIFEQARKSQVILFFDEADVLFSKRTEIKDSNDKYNNMEAAFLLQKMEEYEGVTILATNYYQNFDEAFKRRIDFVVNFPFPDYHSRKKLWEISFPKKTPRKEIDYEYLAQTYELSGSNIRNIVLQSAFFAASKNEVVQMKHILEALHMEYAKSGKILGKEEVGEYYMYLDLDGGNG